MDILGDLDVTGVDDIDALCKLSLTKQRLTRLELHFPEKVLSRFVLRHVFRPCRDPTHFGGTAAF